MHALGALERQLLDGFARAGYQPIRTPILEFTELHERKSGAGIVSKLFELASGGPGAICLRPELTASIVRAFAEARECPPLPWRVSSSGPVFRYESDTGSARLREFTQVGVELLGRRRARRRRRGDRPGRPVALGRRRSRTQPSGSATSG